MDIVTILLGILYLLNIIFAAVVIFIERRDAGATWAWVLILFFVPVAGFILYLIFGQNLSRKRLFDWGDIKKIGIEDLINNQTANIRNPDFFFKESYVNDYRNLIYMHLINNDAVLTEGNSVDIFLDGEEKFASLLKDIEQAKDHIHLQYYIFRNDGLGGQIIDALAKKAEEGVKVRVLYDDMGSRLLTKKDFKAMTQAGGEVGIFFPSRIPFINLRLNYRNHRKLVIIDGEIGYVGGFNVGDEYLGLSKKFGYWRDTHLKLKGEAVNAIQTRFILDWNQASKSASINYQDRYFPPKKTAGDVAAQIVSSGPDSEWEQIKNGYIKMIHSARKSIYIQTPYFIPDASLLDTLRIAALSGKDVSIMIPNKPDHPFVYWATYSYIFEMLKAGARVFIYEKGFIHAKTLVVDGKVSSVGTANIDVRSFRLNFEVNAFLYNAQTSKELALAFENDIKDSRELTKELYAKRSVWIKFKESIARLLSPIL
ncbi:cardiolipin synthase [Thalassorhabdus alkalitolerans]|uniref:Cardiolipin synthase n=1 Tax=Thalassorhabdus alkalitolerans TaxID=2282697 RepID=A0ABW0YL60_9BACI